MTVLEQIQQLEAQKAKLLDGAKQEALDKAMEAIKVLNSLGFNYQLINSDKPTTSTGTRRSGVRTEVLQFVKDNPGTTRAHILVELEAKGDKKAEQSISNALSNLKKGGDITLEDGKYHTSQP